MGSNIRKEQLMKFAHTAIAAALGLAFCGAAFAQAGTIQRDVNQQQRIEQGLKSGQLTTREGARQPARSARRRRRKRRPARAAPHPEEREPREPENPPREARRADAVNLPGLRPGLRGEASLIVAEEHTAPRVGSGAIHVLAT